MIDHERFARAKWRKSSRSGSGGQGGGDCVEIAGIPGIVGVRDSKDEDGPVIALATQAWTALVAEIKSGGYTLP